MNDNVSGLLQEQDEKIVLRLKNDCDKIVCCNELKRQLSRDENMIMIVNVVLV